jgi:predicted nuclease of restriction endonuclease-like (RecB) superfamily
MTSKPVISDSLYTAIAEVIQQARQQVKRSVNQQMVQAYWLIGQLIVEQEQQGQERAEYGKQQLSQLSMRLQNEFGKGFDVTNLRNMRQFYLTFPKRDALRLELSWTHYRSLIRIENPIARDWYASEAVTQNWSVRALERQIGVLYYERLLASKNNR